MQIPFNKPYMTGKEIQYIAKAHKLGKLAGDGDFTAKCHDWLEQQTGCNKALLTHSCTAALEMAAILLDLQPGDEVIMPSYTFVSTANAFVLRGAVPVFVDIRSDTLNIDEKLIEAAITARTRAIVPVHYAGVACEMDTICAIAARHGLKIVEDAAQGVMSTYNGRPLGTIGDIGAYSFHETKNVISGEGGALLVNRPDLATRAEIIREKGTDRARFFRGVVDKYTWQDIGSSFLPGEIIAAFLLAQLEDAQNITALRLARWDYYHTLLEKAENEGLLTRPSVPAHCGHNAHMYYVLLPAQLERQVIMDKLKEKLISTVFHYIPLHNSPAGQHFGRAATTMAVTDDASARILRLPLWVELTGEQQEYIVSALLESINELIHGKHYEPSEASQA
ncbi:dTDP-4-amino-4,6-dideoxygalactose transaminase [Arsukibacterium tuosuense]|uniref:dTDP-4-amino-4,6-dideoxygalactose transaminase n=1 Tax=Arsukibacterium tuosuense TaxID=1323745 RepID=A0A285J826_9GAMM|nr:dTDP-4-amino-4,6-dideoxygalactose transaminase [Arsukibacterium tuosuense]SNY56007.1 dTDP-4-amino-4,6-dideoxygalactose transaminase [Arsukibacterium tuosuense]